MEKLKIGNMNVSFLSATRYHINGGNSIDGYRSSGDDYS